MPVPSRVTWMNWGAWVAVLVTPATMAFAIDLPPASLSLAAPNSTYNTLDMSVSLTPSGLSQQTQTKHPTITGDSSATFGAIFDPVSHQATIQDITFNLQQPGQVSLQNTTFAFSWFFGLATENVDTTNVKLSPYTPTPPTPVSGGLFDANQIAAEFNGGSIVYGGVTSGTQDLASSPLDGQNTSTSSGTVSISAPVMSGNVATYTTTVIVPLAVNEPITGSGYTAQIVANGALKSSGTFQFDFGPRTVNWNAPSGDFKTGGNWDVGFAPRTGDTLAIPNGGESTLSAAFAAVPAAAWIGNGVAASGTLALADSSSLTCGAMVLGQSGAAGTLILGGGTLSVPSITQGAGGHGTIYLTSGTLRATASSSHFLTGLSDVFIGAGGATIDSNGFSLIINQPLLPDPALGTTADGGLLKAGAGTLSLSGTNTYTGGTTVSGGTFELTNPDAIASGSSLTVGTVANFSLGATTDPLSASCGAAAVPEPGTLALLCAAGITAAAAWGKRRGTFRPESFT
jgi:autotransporter-associated beta strand protein